MPKPESCWLRFDVHSRTCGLASKRLAQQMQEVSEEVMAREVERQIGSLTEIIDKTQEVITKKLDHKFDTLTAIILGEDSRPRRQGKLSIPEIIKQKYQDNKEG
jgi:hypothetical protein